MQYLAIVLLALGVILIVAGYFINFDKTKTNDAVHLAQQFAERTEFLNQKQNSKSDLNANNQNDQNNLNNLNLNQDTQAQVNTSGQNPNFQEQNHNPSGNQAYVQMPNAHQQPQQSMQQPQFQSQAVNQNHVPPTAPIFYPNQAANIPSNNNIQQPVTQQNHRVEVFVKNENPRLFQKSAYLYLDSSKENNYTGQESSFTLKDVVGIRRFGQGVFAYDGFSFTFDHPSGTEKFILSDIDHLAFYPNCLVLSLKNDLPAALLFVDETNSIRKILETFKVGNAG